jgi:hypothetical protein
MWTRRELLARTGLGFGGVALSQLLAADAFAPKAPHFAPKAKRVIFLFLNGGMSQVDTFDPKPVLDQRTTANPCPAPTLKTDRAPAT